MKKRVGLMSKEGPPARDNTKIFDEAGQEIGIVTSGCPSPSLGQGVNIAMGYVPANMSKSGSKVRLSVRKRIIDAVVTKMPFVPTNYYNPGKK